MYYSLQNSFVNSLYTREVVKRNDVTVAVVDSMNFVYNKSIDVWKDLLDWGNKFLYLSSKDESFINLAIDFHLGKKIPSDKQFTAIVKVYDMLQKEGYKEKV